MNEIDQTAIFISVEDQYAGYITFSDVIRPEAEQTIASIKAMSIDQIMMVTGDKKTIAEEIAKKVGITNVQSGCLPKDKINFLKKLSIADRPVIMVGDGVNDAPALMAADIGIAMSAHGSTAASESADVVILKDDLSKVSDSINIAKRTMRIAQEAVFIGIFICICLMLAASFGGIPTLIGALLQEVVDVVSIFYALRAHNDQ